MTSMSKNHSHSHWDALHRRKVPEAGLFALTASAGSRLMVCAVLLGVLWAAVFWAVA